MLLPPDLITYDRFAAFCGAHPGQPTFYCKCPLNSIKKTKNSSIITFPQTVSHLPYLKPWGL